MSIIIGSDIHGGSEDLKKLIKLFKEVKAEKLILLGDIYNHGPRNPFPDGYAPMEVAKMLNEIKKDLIVIKGNCDSEVDTLISDFDFLDSMVIREDKKNIFLTHGHVYNKDNLPKTQIEVLIYGHFHTGFILKNQNMIIANSGSISLPKDGTEKSFLLLENNSLSLKNLENKTINNIKL